MKKNNKSILILGCCLLFVFFFVIHSYADDDIDALSFEDEFNADNQMVSDPLEPYNRVITSINDKMYFWLLEPVSKGYSEVLPEGGRMGVDNFFHNITFPIRFVNNILQLKIKKAGIETARFFINSTMGMAGLLDPAKDCFDLNSYNEDFGQTLGFYNIGSIFHIDWPFIGPSNVRDTVGYIADFFLNPINYIPNMWIVTGLHVLEKINKTSLHIGEYDKLKKESVDYYLQIRDSYEQFRNKEIEE